MFLHASESSEGRAKVDSLEFRKGRSLIMVSQHSFAQLGCVGRSKIFKAQASSFLSQHLKLILDDLEQGLTENPSTAYR